MFIKSTFFKKCQKLVVFLFIPLWFFQFFPCFFLLFLFWRRFYSVIFRKGTGTNNSNLLKLVRMYELAYKIEEMRASRGISGTVRKKQKKNWKMYLARWEILFLEVPLNPQNNLAYGNENILHPRIKDSSNKQTNKQTISQGDCASVS